MANKFSYVWTENFAISVLWPGIRLVLNNENPLGTFSDGKALLLLYAATLTKNNPVSINNAQYIV